VMFEHSEKRLGERLKFDAQLHGAKIEEKPIARAPEEMPVKPKGSFMFGDPEAYKDIPEAQRQEITDRMMNKHKIWSQEGKPLGGKTMRAG